MICEKKKQKSAVPPLSQNSEHKLVSHIAISLIKTILMFWTRRFEEAFNLTLFRQELYFSDVEVGNH